MSVSSRSSDSSRLKAVLGPTNTGKTHLAIERLCAHSSGAIGFPLRLLAREVYDKVCAIKGPSQVALITGEEKIEPMNARYLLCTVEAMPVGADLAFVALDEAQLAADRERGHIFTDRLLHARGREETMLLGSATIEPLIKALLPRAEVVSRPRFSTLTHSGARKLSRIPPRSAIVAFSAEQVYAVAEMLRRFRGGSAVVMGALSPETRNRQVALYQSGEVDYLVATDAIGMGLNLDIDHVAFAGLSKFDGQRQRRLTITEMAQIAGRAGRHQRDGTFGTLAGSGNHDAEFTPEEIYGIEEHRFPPLTRLFWREPEPDCSSIGALLEDLARFPQRPELALAPEAIDLAVLRRLAEDTELVAGVRSNAQVARLWDVCRLPDFRQHGAEVHSRFVARLWQDLRSGMLGGDYIAQAIAQLDNPSGDIDTLQMRIAAIRSWAYIAQRPDWVLAREEMAARARAAEARLSDALHARLTERFVSRRTSVLMKKLGPDSALLPVALDDDTVLVDGESIGHLAGFRFVVDPAARFADHKLLLAAAERHLPELRRKRAEQLLAELDESPAYLRLVGAVVQWNDDPVARLKPGRTTTTPRIALEPALATLEPRLRERLAASLEVWLAAQLAPLAPLRQLEAASTDPAAGAMLRALLIKLVDAGGMLERQEYEVAVLDKDRRAALRKLGVRIGALDLFMPAMLKPAAMAAWTALRAADGQILTKTVPGMVPAIPLPKGATLPPGYRRLGDQALRIDLAEKLLHAAHAVRVARGSKAIVLNPALAVSIGLSTGSYARLLRLGGFGPIMPLPLAPGAFGPAQLPSWRWLPPGRGGPAAPDRTTTVAPGNAFAALAELLR